MSEPAARTSAPSRKPVFEQWLEQGLFSSRWLIAPFYVGLVIGLVVLLFVFVGELLHELPHVVTIAPGGGLEFMSPDKGIMLALSLIDLSLAGNLLLIVIFSGYENFVSKIDVGDHEDRPGWMGTVDFSGLKMKLVASIVAISAIALLKAFMELTKEGAALDQPKLLWLVVIHLTFVGSGVLLALMDLLNSKTDKH